MNDFTALKLPDLLLALKRKIVESTKENRLKHELTVSQLEALWFIGSAERTSMESIATHLKIKPPSVTSLIGKMEKDGYVMREKDPYDRRVVNVTLTSKLKKEFVQLRAQKEQAFTELVKKLSTHDKKELERILLLLIK